MRSAVTEIRGRRVGLDTGPSGAVGKRGRSGRHRLAVLIARFGRTPMPSQR